MMIVLILFSLIILVLYSMQKKTFAKLPGPIGLLLLNQKVIFANRAFRRERQNPTFSHLKTVPIWGRWFSLATYEAPRSDPQEEFIASVCHELKTPLTIIKGFSEMMNSLQNPSVTVLESAMKKIFLASVRMEKTIQNLTILEEIEHLSSKKKISCNLSHLLDSIKSQLLLTYPHAHIEIAADFDSDFTIEANQGLLEVALSNLTSNALKYSKEEDPYAKITMAFERGDPEEEHLTIQVEDRGIGIAEEELPKIFDRFYRSYDPKAQKRKGSGLGLAIAKKIIENHGGTLEVRSVAGEGTVFTLALPLACPLVALPS